MSHKVRVAQSRKNGKCNLQGCELKDIPIELMAPFDHLEGNELPQYVSMLTKLSLNDNEITTIPNGIGGIGDLLVTFEIRNNKLKAVPASLSELPSLKVVDASNNEVEAVEDLALPKLADLNLSKNRLVSLPSNFGASLESLSRLTLSNNQLQSLPASVGELPCLRHLEVEFNKLSGLPSFGAKQPCLLETLLAASNKLTALPPSLAQCSNLTELNVSMNKLTKWPALPTQASASSLPPPPRGGGVRKGVGGGSSLGAGSGSGSGGAGGGLVKLVLSHNSIPSIDAEALLALRFSLRELQMASCGLSECPEEVGALKHLRCLNVSDNALKDIPGNIGHLPDLSVLTVSGNPIRRKRLEGTTKDMKDYLKTKSEPHPSLMEGSVDPRQGKVLKLLREAAHYGTLRLVGQTAKNKNQGPTEDQLTEFPSEVCGTEFGSKLSEIEITHHANLTHLPTDKFPDVWGTSLRILNLEKNALGKGALGVLLPEGHLGNSKSKGKGGAAAQLATQPKAFPPLFEALAQLKALLVLQLRGNGLTDEHISEGQSGVSDAAMARGLGSTLKELDLSQNNLTQLPTSLVLRCPHLTTFRCGFNSLQGLDDQVPLLHKCKLLQTVELPNNQLTGLGQLRFHHSLVTLNVEENQLKTLPLELSRLKGLRFLSAARNPQRSVPGDVVSSGPEVLLKFLANRTPPDWQEPAWVETARQGKVGGGSGSGGGEVGRGEEEDDAASTAGSTDSGRMGARFYKKQQESSGSGGGGGNSSSAQDGAAAAAAEGGDDSSSGALSATSHLTEELAKVQLQIAAIETRLERDMSAATKHATKKELQIKRAARTKIQRQMKEAEK